jgi:hypothetical protein
MKATNPTTLAARRYAIEFTVAILAYLVVLFGTRLAFRDYHGPWLTAIALLPVVPIFFVFLAGVRLFAKTDEFNKRIMTDSLAAAGVITALVAATYGFAEGTLVPRPSAWWTWSVFMVSWLIASFILRWRYR